MRACDISLDISWPQQDNRTALPPDISHLKPAATVQWWTSRLWTPSEADPHCRSSLCVNGNQVVCLPIYVAIIVLCDTVNFCGVQAKSRGESKAADTQRRQQ